MFLRVRKAGKVGIMGEEVPGVSPESDQTSAASGHTLGTFKVETETDGCGSAPGPSAGGTFRRGLPASRGVACRFELRTGQ